MFLFFSISDNDMMVELTGDGCLVAGVVPCNIDFGSNIRLRLFNKGESWCWQLRFLASCLAWSCLDKTWIMLDAPRAVFDEFIMCAVIEGAFEFDDITVPRSGLMACF